MGILTCAPDSVNARVCYNALHCGEVKFMDSFLTIVVIIYIGGMIYLANLLELDRAQGTSLSYSTGLQRVTFLRWLLVGLLLMLFMLAFFLLQATLLDVTSSAPTEALPEIEPGAAIINLVVIGVVSFIALRLIFSARLRQAITSLTGKDSRYDPESYVHLCALVLTIWYIGISFSQLTLAGGLEGIAQSIAQNGISIGEITLQAVILVLLALLGVGLFIRRGDRDSIARLGLRLPTRQDVTIGVGVGLGLFIFSIAGIFLWQQSVSPEQYAQQNVANQAVNQMLNSLPLGLIVALSAAFGEEILFRGAVQPVFGLVMTSLTFALFHNQYFLTPAALIIFLIGIGLGLLRQRVSTTSAIIAHFVYNFLPFVLALLPVAPGSP